ncbi:hypothetical protein AB832_02410 [Flavobacteriaceae bacterium (ex Bugula neritina AB1)]|nr:hypothetical protein AB832_02410 [Flavobacteriaceae bacterium (ex Bugula neritina AB1)]
MTLVNNNLEKLAVDEISTLAEFVVTENFKHHSNNNLPINYKNDIISISEEEVKSFNNSDIFVVKDSLGKISGSIRVLKWNYQDELPIEKIFGINPIDITGHSPLKHIWHIGRFAIKKESKDITLFKRLMVCAIAPICTHENSVAFAECDSKLLRVLLALGIKATVIGEPIDYLGSETIPVCLPYEGLIDFYNKNKHLVSENMVNHSKKAGSLPKGVVFNNQHYNYPLV